MLFDRNIARREGLERGNRLLLRVTRLIFVPVVLFLFFLCSSLSLFSFALLFLAPYSRENTRSGGNWIRNAAVESCQPRVVARDRRPMNASDSICVRFRRERGVRSRSHRRRISPGGDLRKVIRSETDLADNRDAGGDREENV